MTRISSLLGSLDALPEKSYPVLADDDVIYKPSFLSWLIAAQSVDHAASFSYYVYRTGGLSVGQGCDGFSFWKPNLACITDLARAHVAETAYRLHDELSISYCLATKGVRVKMIPPPDGSLIYEKNIDASSLQHLSGAQWRERLQRQAYGICCVPERCLLQRAGVLRSHCGGSGYQPLDAGIPQSAARAFRLLGNKA